MKQNTIIISVWLFALCCIAEEPTVYPELSAGRRTFKNASVISTSGSHATVKHDGGLARVEISALPEEIKAKIGHDPEKAALADAEAKAKKEAAQAKLAAQKAELAKVNSWRGEPKNVLVKAVSRDGTCTAKIDGEGTKEIRLKGLPTTTAKFFADLQSLDQQIIAAKQTLKEALRAFEDIPSEVTGSISVVAAWEANVKRARDKVRVAEDNLQMLEQRQENLVDTAQSNTFFSARKTAHVYGKCEIWEYLGPGVMQKRD